MIDWPGDGALGAIVLHHHIDTDNWVFRRCGLHGYGWSPFVLDDGEWARVHGNDERISLENLRSGVRSYTEMLLGVAAS